MLPDLQLPYQVFRVASRVTAQPVMTLRRYEWSTFAQYSYSSSLLENDPDHKTGTHMGRPRFIIIVDLSRTLVQPVSRNTVFRVSCSYGDENEWISGGEEGNTGILGRENPFGGVHYHDVLPPWSYPSEDMHCKLEGKMLPTADVTSHAPLLTFPGDQDARQERRFSILRIPEEYIKTGAWARPIALLGRTDGWHTVDEETKLADVECKAGAAVIIQVHISRVRGTHEESGRQVPLRVQYADTWTGALMFADSAGLPLIYFTNPLSSAISTSLRVQKSSGSNCTLPLTTSIKQNR